MANRLNYLDFITGTHNLYNRYYNDWRLAVKSFYGGVEYRNGQYLKQYSIDASQQSDVINTYDLDDSGNQTAVYKTKINVNTPQDLNSSAGYLDSFYAEKLENVPVLPYTRLYVSEYNAILFRSPPVRELTDTPEVTSFVQDVSGDGESINEFMSKVDTFSTVYGVVWVSCIKPSGAEYPRWRMYSPLDVLNWSHTYTADGDLELDKILIRTASEPDFEIFQYMTPETIETIFMPADEDTEINLPEGAEYLEDEEGKGFYRIVQENELGHLKFVRPVYQSSKIYNGIGHTPIFDIAQIQRSIYGDYGEIYSSISYGSHPVTIVDETTLAQNDFNVGAEPGAVINVQAGLNGQPNYVFEFKAPPLDSIQELRALVDQKIEKMNQIAMVRSDELIKASRSGVQIEMYDSKLEAFIRKKAVSLENVEAHYLWPTWYEWQGIPMPTDLTVSYNRLYSQKGLENELKEIDMLISTYDRFNASFGAEVEYTIKDFNTQAEAEAEAKKLGGLGFHTHEREDGLITYMPFATHEELEMRMEMRTGVDSEEVNYKEDMREKIKERLNQLIEGSYTNNSL
tara:strand:- start:7258 stop:8967 length:1710 start_codon:yes stop_codon:yes gene_type:complete